MTLLGFKMPVLQLKAADGLLCAALVALLIAGFIAMSSASIEFARNQYQNPFHHMQRHGFYLLLALLGGVAVFHIPSATLDRHGWWLLLLGIALLCLVLAVGREVNGSKRWLAIGPFTVQVSEFVKLFVVIYMAGYLVRRRDEVRSNLKGFLKPLVVMSILIFAMVPLIRYTVEGLRSVPTELTEAADMSSATRLQKLWNVQLPLALPTMTVGFNQAIMFAFFMVINAAFKNTPQPLLMYLSRRPSNNCVAAITMNTTIITITAPFLIVLESLKPSNNNHLLKH